MTTMPPDNENPPAPPESESHDSDAEAFANEWAEMRQQQEDDHTLLTQMADALESFLGMDNRDHSPTEPRHTPRPPQKGTARPDAGPQGESPILQRTPDVPPEENHWYWKKRFRLGKRG